MTYCETKNIPIVMIIGAPRSGTTILGSILDHHPSISTWIEPYYIWDHYFREAPHDERDASDANAEVQSWIRNAFSKYRKDLKVDRVVDKSPRNCLKLPFVQQIFPEAHYIFLLRDGRDTILSIRHQWRNKELIFAANEERNRWRNRSTRRPTRDPYASGT